MIRHILRALVATIKDDRPPAWEEAQRIREASAAALERMEAESEYAHLSRIARGEDDEYPLGI